MPHPSCCVLLFGCSNATPADTAPETTSVSAATGGATSGSTMGQACDNLAGGSFTVGDIASNWSLENNLGAVVELFHYCGKVIFYEEGSGW